MKKYSTQACSGYATYIGFSVLCICCALPLAHISVCFLERCPSVCPSVRLSVHMSVCQPTKIILWLIFFISWAQRFFQACVFRAKMKHIRTAKYWISAAARLSMCPHLSLLSLLRLFRSNVNSRCFQRSRFRLESLRLETTTSRGPSMETCSRTLILTDFEHFKKKGSTEI
jgi:hypothetical protein